MGGDGWMGGWRGEWKESPLAFAPIADAMVAQARAQARAPIADAMVTQARERTRG